MMPLPAFLDISTGEFFVMFIAIFIVFGPKKVPEIARQIGKGMNELKKVTSDLTKEFKEGVNQVKDEVDILKPDRFGNVPYVPPVQIGESTPPPPNARPFSSTPKNDIPGENETSEPIQEVKQTNPPSNQAEEINKSEDKGLLF